jgi:hypothetical protein
MPYVSSQYAQQAVQLAVQSMTVQLADNSVVSTSGSTATVDVGNDIDHVTCALFVDDSAATCAPVVASNRSVSGSTVTLTLSAALAADDAIILQYVTVE